MIELSGGREGQWRMGYAGDTFNAAWYARAVLPAERAVAYVTAIGDDPFSAGLKDFIAAAGVETDRIRIVAAKRPGLYAITLSEGERSFTYWRGESAARCLADDAEWLEQALAGVELLYVSGITLAILAPEARARLVAALAARRAAGAKVAFDPNFRPVLWPDAAAARDAFEAAFAIADFALPTFDDEAKLYGDRSPEATAARIAALGVPEVVVKNGAGPCLVASAAVRMALPPAKPAALVDTTGAGDSFAGSYLAARLMGRAPAEAARIGHAVAGQVVGVHGALTKIDREVVLRA